MKKNLLKYTKSPLYKNIKGLCHGFFNRNGGFSPGNFSSLNISFDVGDEEYNVAKNRRLILNEFSMEKMVTVNQVHGFDFYIPGPLDGVYGERFKGKKDADIIITDNPGQLLLIKTADCQPVLIVDPDKRICAAVHSGWKGSVSNVICRAVDKMIESYNCNPVNLIAGIGPSLGPCCAEFVNYRKEIPEEFWKYRVGEYNFDFWEISIYQLEKAGLVRKNIWVDGRCTKCNHEDFFSYRNNKNTGRQASVVGWFPEYWNKA